MADCAHNRVVEYQLWWRCRDCGATLTSLYEPVVNVCAELAPFDEESRPSP